MGLSIRRGHRRMPAARARPGTERRTHAGTILLPYQPHAKVNRGSRWRRPASARAPANDLPLPNHYHGPFALSSPSRCCDRTSQTPPPKSVSTAPSAPSSSLTQEEVTVRAVQQERDGTVYKLRGQAEIHYRNYVLYADEITYNSASGDASVEGHVVLDGGPYDEHVEASHGDFNVRAQAGTFYDVIGTAGFRLRRSGYVLTTSNPFAFTGKIVEKQGPDHYLVRQGTVTTCELPNRNGGLKPAASPWTWTAARRSTTVPSNSEAYRLFIFRSSPTRYRSSSGSPGS